MGSEGRQGPTGHRSRARTRRRWRPEGGKTGKRGVWRSGTPITCRLARGDTRSDSRIRWRRRSDPHWQATSTAPAQASGFRRLRVRCGPVPSLTGSPQGEGERRHIAEPLTFSREHHAFAMKSQRQHARSTTNQGWPWRRNAITVMPEIGRWRQPQRNATKNEIGSTTAPRGAPDTASALPAQKVKQCRPRIANIMAL